MIRPVGSSGTVQAFLSELVTGKKVLDVGCVAHSAEREGDDAWLHKHLCRTAAHVTGVDIVEEGVLELNRRGYYVVCGDAAAIDLGQRFDVAVAGEIIEHVDNPGVLVRNLRKHLTDDGLLVLTTPNIFFALHFAESILFSPYGRWNPEHVSNYCYFTLENLLDRNGMRVKDCYYFCRSRKTRKLLRALSLRPPGWLASTIVAVARKK
jgi:2-polyprenyl-3-methyl-5-hydroxy-6-metoxy-1,4-benzoquinol methylase